MPTFYLKKQKDVDSDGNHTYNILNSLDLDGTFRKISLGKARRKHELKKLIGNGQKIIESQFREPQNIKGTLKQLAYETNNAFEDRRRDFLKNWVYSEDEIYLYRVENDRTSRKRVWLDQDSSEDYSYYPISDDIDFIILSEKPFFNNIVETTINFNKTSTTEEIIIDNEGEYTPFEVEFTLTANTSTIIIRTFENRAVEINYSFTNGSVVRVDLADLIVYINDIERTSIDITGSPFSLIPGENTLRIISTATGTGTVTYTERYL